MGDKRCSPVPLILGSMALTSLLLPSPYAFAAERKLERIEHKELELQREKLRHRHEEEKRALNDRCREEHRILERKLEAVGKLPRDKRKAERERLEAQQKAGRHRCEEDEKALSLRFQREQATLPERLKKEAKVTKLVEETGSGPGRAKEGLPPGLELQREKRGGKLSPGLQKQVEEKRHLPPGLEKRD